MKRRVWIVAAIALAPASTLAACGALIEPPGHDAGDAPDTAVSGDIGVKQDAMNRDTARDSPREAGVVFCNQYAGAVDAGYDGKGWTSKCPLGWTCSWCQCQFMEYSCWPPDM